MTRSEWIKQATAEEIAERLCDIMTCTDCPAEELCMWGQGHGNGLLKWLEEEHDDN